MVNWNNDNGMNDECSHVTFLCKVPKVLKNFCKLIKLLHSKDYPLYFHGPLAWPHAIILKLPPGGWQVVQEMHFSFYPQNKEMVQRKKQLSRAGVGSWGMPAWTGGLQNPGGASLARQRAREADGLLMKVIQKHFCTRHLGTCGPVTQFWPLRKWNIISPLDLHAPFPRYSL